MKRKIIIFLLFTLILFITNILPFTSLFSNEKQFSLNNNENLRISYFKWATLELTNPSEVNESRFPHNSMISIKGRIYSKSDGTNKSGIEVIIQVDSIDYPSYNDITDFNGIFTINYIIDPNLYVYSPHQIKAIPINYVTNPPGGFIENPDFYIINVNTTSYFDITSTDDPATPKLTEETFSVTGFLKFENGLGIPNKKVDYTWFDGAIIVDQDFFLTDGIGALSDIQVPITSASDLTLKLNFSEPNYVEYSENIIYNIKIFSDVTWNLNIDYTTTEGATYVLTGTLFSSTDPSLRIRNREVEVYFNNTHVASTTTNINGYFTSSFLVPLRNGTASIQVRLVNFIGKDISSSLQYILVENAPPSLPIGGGLPPFLLFSIIFFPILGSIVVGLAVYGYKYYKKQEKESRVVNLPLESKIKNLKILKDTGRLEESISYLFNAIYMELINAKYNRKRKQNETIRDFAIISVKELRLTPSSIYPFIQKVEEIIYAKPFKITEKDFYNTCELFSPIYFQLTGYNFVLNF
ncbi:MAG: hypothetical protein ACFE9N_05385 [Promethearchaeota archaeon]